MILRSALKLNGPEEKGRVWEMQLLEEIEISYFRSFYKFKLRQLKDLNIVFGKNDSGKSNVIRALNLFFPGNLSTHSTSISILTSAINASTKPARLKTFASFYM